MLDDVKVCSPETPSGASGQQEPEGHSQNHLFREDGGTHGSVWGCRIVEEAAAASARLHNEAGRVCRSKVEHKQHHSVTTAVIKARFTPPPRAGPHAQPFVTISRRITPVNQIQPLTAAISSSGVILEFGSPEGAETGGKTAQGQTVRKILPNVEK